MKKSNRNKSSAETAVLPSAGGASTHEEMVAIEKIEIASSVQVRMSINDEVVSEYAERFIAGDDFPPVLIFYDGKTRWLADGFHRIAAAIRAGKENIGATVGIGGRRDALKAALGANLHHGLRRTNADKRRAAEIAVNEFPDLSSREISNICGVSNHLVDDVRKQVGESPSLSSRLGRDGKRRAVRPKATTKISEEGAITEETKNDGFVPIDSLDVSDSVDESHREQTVEFRKPHQTVPTPVTPASIDPAVCLHPQLAMNSVESSTEKRPVVLADGSTLSSEYIADGFIGPDWINLKLQTIAIIANPVTPFEKQLCTQHQRLVIRVANALNAEFGLLASPDGLQIAGTTLRDIQDYIVKHHPVT